VRVRLQEAPFDPGAELAGFTGRAAGAGAVVSFTGLVRGDDDAQAPLIRMVIEHYPGMTEKALDAIAAEAASRWALSDALVIHRHGPMRPDEAIVFVATAARHRVAAFEAAAFLMDYLKSRAPFWKKEERAGDERWVAARENDEAALARWRDASG
jgi:molybdopterin synthase catalytic subunit